MNICINLIGQYFGQLYYLQILTTDKKSLSMKLSLSSLFGHTSVLSAILRRAIQRRDSNSPGDPVLVVPSSLTWHATRSRKLTTASE